MDGGLFRQITELLDLLGVSGVSGWHGEKMVWGSNREEGGGKEMDVDPMEWNPPVKCEIQAGKQENLTLAAYQCRMCGKQFKDKESARGHTTVPFKIPQVRHDVIVNLWKKATALVQLNDLTHRLFRSSALPVVKVTSARLPDSTT